MLAPAAMRRLHVYTSLQRFVLQKAPALPLRTLVPSAAIHLRHSSGNLCLANLLAGGIMSQSLLLAIQDLRTGLFSPAKSQPATLEQPVM
jgi:hypothetical protein